MEHEGGPMGIPLAVWLAGGAILVYFIFFRGSSSGGSPSTSGGGGTITQGNTQIQKGAVTITVSQQPPTGHNKLPPGKKPPAKTGEEKGETKAEQKTEQYVKNQTGKNYEIGQPIPPMHKRVKTMSHKGGKKKR